MTCHHRRKLVENIGEPIAFPGPLLSPPFSEFPYMQPGCVRRVVGTIWCVGADKPCSRPVRNANWGNPVKLTNPHLLGGSSVKLDVERDWAPCVAAGVTK